MAILDALHCGKPVTFELLIELCARTWGTPPWVIENHDVDEALRWMGYSGVVSHIKGLNEKDRAVFELNLMHEDANVDDDGWDWGID